MLVAQEVFGHVALAFIAPLVRMRYELFCAFLVRGLSGHVVVAFSGVYFALDLHVFRVWFAFLRVSGPPRIRFAFVLLFRAFLARRLAGHVAVAFLGPVSLHFVCTCRAFLVRRLLGHVASVAGVAGSVFPGRQRGAAPQIGGERCSLGHSVGGLRRVGRTPCHI